MRRETWPEHLAAGNKLRIDRSRRRTEVYALPGEIGLEALAAIIEEPPEECRTLRVTKLHNWVHRFGPHRLEKAIGEANTQLRRVREYSAPIVDQRLMDLTPHQRRALVDRLSEVGPEMVHNRGPAGATETKRAS